MVVDVVVVVRTEAASRNDCSSHEDDDWVALRGTIYGWSPASHHSCVLWSILVRRPLMWHGNCISRLPVLGGTTSRVGYSGPFVTKYHFCKECVP